MKIAQLHGEALQLIRYGFVNCYLVPETDGYTLIDTGLKGGEDTILRAAGKLPIRRILLTHAHVDHVGGVDGLMTRIPGLELLAAARSIPLLRTPADRSVRSGEVGPVRGGTPGIAATVTQTVNEGDRIGSLLAIDTPGHIHGHQSFLDERDGTLYAGDQFMSLGRLCITGFPPWWLPLRVFSSREVAVETAVKLEDYPVQRVACGHGKVLEGGRALIEGAVARARSQA